MKFSKSINIISFDVPYPANYGGVIDVFYKIKAFVELGIKVHLHCYQYGRQTSDILEELCSSVTYYKRKLWKNPISGSIPYIVSTRNSDELLQNLKTNKYPILFEGLHCCYYLSHPELKNRFKIVRTHNIEHLYYLNLMKVEKNYFKKVFFKREAERLKQFESELKNANIIASISPEDKKYFSLKYDNVSYLPVFHGNSKVSTESSKENYCLYHGNLSVGENHEAAMFLLEKVFTPDYGQKLIICGNGAKSELIEATEKNPNVELMIGLTTNQINAMISKAQINLLPTFQATGMKLKLINVLFQAGFVIVNKKMVHQTGLESLCIVADSSIKMKQAIDFYMEQEFDESNLKLRGKILLSNFDNQANAEILIENIFDYNSIRA